MSPLRPRGQEPVNMAKLKAKLTPRCSRTGAVLYLAAALAALALDQWSKAATVANIPMYSVVPAVPGIFQLTHVHNTGAAWSILAGNTGLLGIISIVAIISIGLYLLYGLLCPAARLCLAFVIGGALGNMVDRLNLGYVVDMIEVTFINYPVFNVADCFIVVGGIAFAVVFLFYNDRYLIERGLLKLTEKAGTDEEKKDADKS